MSRLYTVVSTIAEVAVHFDAQPSAGLEIPSETVEALPGFVVFDKNGRRFFRQMNWGFPPIDPGNEPAR